MDRYLMTIVVGTAMLLISTTAGAQTPLRQVGPYVEAGILADVDPDSFEEGTHTVPAATFAAGFTFNSSWTLRFESVLPAWHTTTVDESDSFSGVTESISGTQQHRLSTYSFLVGYEIPIAARIRIVPLVGVGLTNHADKIDIRYQVLRSGAAVMSESEVSENADWLTTFSYGADFVIAVSPRVAIVPQIRFDTVKYDMDDEVGTPRFRPGVGVRLGF
jgi:hypothetical protein